ncbi:MAG: sel1 repeat family protein [Moraxellaceae bacterium]|nr:sel1 repeat family protein [Moraxellaceae bacterium]
MCRCAIRFRPHIRNGQGVPQNYRQAVDWYRRAANQGRSDALNNLGVMYKNGEGC